LRVMTARPNGSTDTQQTHAKSSNPIIWRN
jgi:hypothetical protein